MELHIDLKNINLFINDSSFCFELLALNSQCIKETSLVAVILCPPHYYVSSKNLWQWLKMLKDHSITYSMLIILHTVLLHKFATLKNN